MTSLVYSSSRFQLTPERLESALKQITFQLQGRVLAAYIFGSASTNEFKADSDIDLIIIKENVEKQFPKRGLEFADLFKIYPNIDLLVYSPDEFEAQLADSRLGFWKSVRLSMKQII